MSNLHSSRQSEAVGPHSGRLILVVGASGVGKDSLLDGARRALRDRPDVVFPRRVITRAPDLGGENYLAVSEEDFSEMRKQGRFALHWSAHGLHYGIPLDIENHLRQGRHVVANVSRAVVDEARRRYPGLCIINVTASRKVIEQRLRQRGRESDADIAARLSRIVEADLTGADVRIFDNDGPLPDGIARFLDLITLDQPAGDPVGNSKAHPQSGF